MLYKKMFLPFQDTGPNTQHWLMFDRVVQQLILQTEERPASDIDTDTEKSLELRPQDPDIAPININVKQIVKLLVKEEELVAARDRADEMERENVDIASKLAKKEQQLDLRTQEKEDLETSIARMRERLEKESSNHSQAMQRALNAEMRLEDLQHRYVTEQQERTRLERLVTEGSIPDDQKVAGLTKCNGQAATSPPPPAPPCKIPPPPPPFFSAPPPPPAPGSLPSFAPMAPAPQATKLEVTKKNVPQPANPLKSFNWSKLPDSKLQGTLWSELDDTKLYNSMDLENIDKLFSAYQKNGVAVSHSNVPEIEWGFYFFFIT
jgi:dishevelled associated activator of morphogenesis